MEVDGAVADVLVEHGEKRWSGGEFDGAGVDEGLFGCVEVA